MCINYYPNVGIIIENDKKYYTEIGREEKQREMIIALYKNGVSLDIISKSSGLSIKEIEKILKEEQ